MSEETTEIIEQLTALIEKWGESDDPNMNKKPASLLKMALMWDQAGSGKAKEYRRLLNAQRTIKSSIKIFKDGGLDTKAMEGELSKVNAALSTLGYTPIKRKRKKSA